MAVNITGVSQLSEKELLALFSGFSDGNMQMLEDNEDLKSSLQEKGYLTCGDKVECTEEGKQNTERYWYDCSEVILDELNKNSTIEDVYESVVKRIDLRRKLFFVFIDNLVSIGKINDVSRFFITQGS